MDMPKVSVIIPTFNEEKYIESCLKHLFKQTYSNFEVILSDCNSTDRTVELAEKFPVCILHTLKRNRASACNEALSATAGVYILFTDADVIVPRNWIESFVEGFLKSKDSVKVLGAPNLTPPDDGFWARSIGAIKGISAPVYLKGKLVHVPGCNCAYKREAIKSAPFDEALLTAEDMDVNLRLVAAGGVIKYCKTPVVFHHRRESIGKFAKQMYKYGIGYTHLWNKHMNTLGGKQMALSLLYLGWLLSLPVFFLLSFPIFALAICPPYAMYCLKNRHASPARTFIILPFLEILQHSALAFGTISEVVRIDLHGERTATNKGEK